MSSTYSSEPTYSPPETFFTPGQCQYLVLCSSAALLAEDLKITLIFDAFLVISLYVSGRVHCV